MFLTMRSHTKGFHMQADRSRALRLSLILGTVAVGCSDDEEHSSRLPYAPNETVIIGSGRATVGSTPSGDACLDIPGGECVRPQNECGEAAYADVVINGGGDVNQIICLPVEGDLIIVDVEDGVAVLPDNGAVVILDDGDLLADVVVQGNRGVIYGDSPAEAVIDGDLDLRGNESIVRGVTVTGDVTFDGNDAELYYCVIHGDVILKGNENFVSNCTIFGSIIGSGNEDRVLDNYVAGIITFSSQPEECRDNMSFEDTDDDWLLDEAEADAAEPLACGS